MTALRVLVSRILDLVAGGRREQRLNAEIQAHLDELTEEFVAKGMAAAEARAAARRVFGSVDQIKDEYRDQRGLPGLDTVTQDLRFAVRLLRRNPGFALTAMLVLGLGIGINTMQFTILNAHTLHGLPLEDAERMVYISTFDDRVPDRGVSYRELEDLRSGVRSFAEVGAFSEMPVVIAGDGETADRLPGVSVSAAAITAASIRPLAGRAFTNDDDRPGAAPVVMLTNAAWQLRYGGAAAALGRTILVNGRAATLIGIVSDRSGLPTVGRVWIPLRQTPGLETEKRTARTLRVFARLRDAVTLADSRADVEAMLAAWSREHPDDYRNARVRVIPINERFLGQVSDPTWRAFMTAGCLVLLISCANVANLLMARALHRTRELAIRTALGAGRMRVVRQLLIEGALLAALSGVLGLGFALAGVRIFGSAIPADTLPYWIDYSPDARVIAVLMAVSALTIVVFALVPAVKASRTDVIGVLKDGGPGRNRRTRQPWATAFLAAEFALVVVLLANFAVALRTSSPELPADEALDTRELLTATITLPSEQYPSPADRAEFYRTLAARLDALPAISSSAVADVLPLSGAGEQLVVFAGREQPPDEQPSVATVSVGPRYFQTLALRLTGRDLTERDGTAGNDHVVVNEEFVSRFFEGVNPIGQRIALKPLQPPGAPVVWMTIAGIVPYIRQRPRGDGGPIVYLSLGDAPPVTATLIIRSAADTATLTAMVRQEASAIDPNLPLYRVRTMQQVRRDAQWNGRLSNRFFLFLMWTAVALSTVGLYAVTAHNVTQNRREIGVRMALGARARQVVAMVIRRAAIQVAAGFAAGVICTKIWVWTFPTGREGISATDPASLLIVAVILFVVAMLACLVPTWRATQVNPVAAIRDA
jgi:putative ABC transport system permease protein